jgi:hypothetical protein
MCKRYPVAALLMLALVAGCGPSVEKIAPTSPISGLKTQVAEFDMSSVRVSSYEVATDAFGLEVAQKVAQALHEGGVDADTSPRGAPAMGKVMVEGQVTLIDGGSRALRYWVGFGAGATKFAVRGRVRTADGKVLGEFSDERRSGFGMFGGDTETLMHRCVESVAYDVANMIITGEYRQ